MVRVRASSASARKKAMDVTEDVRTPIKEMMLPELDRIQKEDEEIKATFAQ